MRLIWQTLAALTFGVLLLNDGAIAQTSVPINISLTNYAFTPSMLTLKVGATYRLHFSNDGSKGHNFNAPAFFAASQIAPADMSKLEDGSVELDNGQSADITVTPRRAGIYAVDCSHFLHRMLGMHGSIVVE